MKEGQFRDKLYDKLKKKLPKKYVVKKGENLLYKLFIDAEGELEPANYRQPKRGHLAFQTDMLIKNNKVPLVACMPQ